MLQLGRHAAYRARTLVRSNVTARRFLSQDSTLLNDLSARGLIADITRPDQLAAHLNESKRCVYAGIDPTAKSLHVGHLLPMMVLLHFRVHGHYAIPLIGGATALVGDPSGRTDERKSADHTKIEHDTVELAHNVDTFFERAVTYARTRAQSDKEISVKSQVLNNATWLKDLNLLHFLSTAGKHVRLNTMLSRESVRSRLESQKGITFTEFTYQLLQAYDFSHLYKTNNCTIQIGGSDQWGNILAGLEMINRENIGPMLVPQLPEERGFGMTTPLLTTVSGQKFGKSAGNAIWLDEKMTSVFEFYQFFLNTADADVDKYLRMFTLLPLSKIDGVIEEHYAEPEKRMAQRLLADEVTEMVHGHNNLNRACITTKIIFGTDCWSLNTDEVTSAFAGDPCLIFCKDTEMFSQTVTSLASAFELVPSKSEASRLIKSKGLYLNNKPLENATYKLTRADLIDGRMAILRAGKSRHLILTLS